MFKKLKLKFILTSMILLTSILVIICVFLYVSSVQNNKEMLFSQMNIFNGGNPNGKKHDFEGRRINDGLIINVDNGVNIGSYNTNYDLTNEDVVEITNTVYNSKNKENRGFIEYNDTRYAYVIEKAGPMNEIIVVRNSELHDEYVVKLTIEVIVIGVLSWVALLFVSVIVAKKAVKPVEASYYAQKRFIQDASHELKTPLAVIKTNMDVVTQDKDETIMSQEKWLNYISFQTDRMSKLVNDLLYLAKADNNEQIGTEKEFIISDSIMEQALSFEAVTFENNLELVCDIDEEISFYGDKERINQLTGILLDNAIKHAYKNTKINLSLKYQKQKIRLMVQNSGITIDRDDIEKIFDRFYRADKARSREKGGYGLGLSIAKSIAEGYKGNIWAESQNEITKFIVEFPVKSKRTTV